MANATWTTDQLPDLSGRTVVITGGSRGLGEGTSRELARVGARVVLAVRNVQQGKAVADRLHGDAEVRALDLASLASIRSFAQEWAGDIDVLIANAGVMQVPHGHTVDGFELQMGINHLGHFALTNLLLPHVTDRIVVVTSQLHRQGRIHLEDLNSERRAYDALGAYRDSKLANVLFALELHRRLASQGSGVRAVAAHPGIAPTALAAHVGGLAGFMQRRVGSLIGNTLEHAVLPTLFAATQDVPGGSYTGPNGLAHLRGFPETHEPSEDAQDPRLAAQLWDVSATLTATGVPLAVRAAEAGPAS